MKIDLRWAVAGLALFAAACDKKDADKAVAPSAPVAAVAPPAGTEWTEVVRETPEGGFLMGNPNAPVKIIEYGSLTCPHCAEFSKEAAEPLKQQYIKTGKVSWEFRNFLLQPVDVSVTVLARCQGAGPFFKLVEQIYAEQPVWVAKFGEIPEAEQKRIAALPDQERIGAIAKAGKLDEFFRARGLPESRIDACLADKSAVDKLVAMRQQGVDMGVDGTPSFFINGTKADGVYDWNTLQAKLRTATGT
jgi:protein-disulfide isomerase